MKKIPTLRVALRVRLRYATLRMTGYIKPSPAGKVPSVSEADEEINAWINEKLIVKTIIKNKQRLFNQIMQTKKMLSSSVCSFVASTFPAGEG